jgi:glycerol-3-phosphate acyltransferase PlsY
MMNSVALLFLIPASYLLGSIPFGVLVARSKGVDIKKEGSGNIGATNVLRTMGKGPAVVTLLGDFLKGSASVLLCRVVLGGDLFEGITGIAAVLGHMYSVFLSMRGGKGVATGFGVLAVYSPVSAVISVAIWLLAAFITGYSSLAALTAFIFLPFIFSIAGSSASKVSFALVLAFLIILSHRENIRRLLSGSETRMGEKKR